MLVLKEYENKTEFFHDENVANNEKIYRNWWKKTAHV